MSKREVFSASSPLSRFMLGSVLQMYRNGIHNLAQDEYLKNRRVGTNGYCGEAVAGYMLLIIVWESSINYEFIDNIDFKPHREHLLQYIEPDSPQWGIERKTHLFPLMMFGKTFNRSTQPYQDFKQLLRLRNSLTHFQESNLPTTVVRDLASKRKTLPAEEGSENGWPLQICSLEAFRWAINTIVLMLQELADLLPEEQTIHRNVVADYYLTDEKVRQLFIKSGLDPDYTPSTPFHFPHGVHVRKNT